MKKFDTVEDLAKAAGHLAGHFGKAASHHQAMADAHAGLNKEHTEMSAFHKGMHDALDDGHEQKAFHKRMHEHHATKAAHHDLLHKLHKAHADHMEEMAKAYGEEKVAGGGKKPPAGTGKAAAAGAEGDQPNGVEGMIAKTVEAILTKSLSTVETSGKVEEMVERMVVERVNKALGNHIVPDGVRATIPSNPPDDVLKHLQLVPRGSSGASLEKAQVEAGMEDALAI